MEVIQQNVNRKTARASVSLPAAGKSKSGLWQVSVAVFLFLASFACTAWAQNIVVDATPGHVTNTIRPTEAVGAGIDRLPYDAADKLFVDST